MGPDEHLAAIPRNFLRSVTSFFRQFQALRPMVHRVSSIGVADLDVEDGLNVSVCSEALQSANETRALTSSENKTANLLSSLRATDHFLAAPRISLSVCVVFSRRMARKTQAVTIVGWEYRLMSTHSRLYRSRFSLSSASSVSASSTT